jgi:hypothetical protein
MKWNHVFRVLIHIDVVEDMLFYDFPREELIAYEKIPWRDFRWQFGKADGELDEKELHPPTRVCGQDWRHPPRHPDDDDDAEREHRRSRGRSFMGRMSSWFDNHSKRRGRDGGSDWYMGESSHARHRRNDTGIDGAFG